MLYFLPVILYVSYIGVGLPNGILSAAWPTMHESLGAALSGAGTVSMLMSACTIAASVGTPFFLRRIGTKNTAALCIALTAFGLLGTSFCRSFFAVCLCAVPYGLGAGGIDVALNDFLAWHYKSRYLAWMHCMWGLGASVGPYIVAYALETGGWTLGYRCIGLLQLAVVAMLFMSTPLWKRAGDLPAASEKKAAGQSTRSVLRSTPGAGLIIGMFFCYCALEKTASLWCGSYLVYSRGFTAEKAAAFVSLFFFVSVLLSDKQMVRLGSGALVCGLLVLLAVQTQTAALVGFFLIGLGCSPIYPCIIHMTPALFGEEKAQTLIGIELAGAYVGSLSMPPLFGLLANAGKTSLLPAYILALTLGMIVLHELLHRRYAARCED